MVKKDNLLKIKLPVIAIGGSILISLLLGVLLGRPFWDSMQRKRTELKEKQAILTVLEDKLTKLKNLKDKETELKEKNKKVLAALPSTKDISRLFTQLEVVAAKNGLLIERVAETTELSQSGGSSIRNLNYNVTGKTTSYASLKNTLSEFQNALRLLSVSSVNANVSNNNVTVNLVVGTYTRGEK